jgi:TRAP-type C4-dicarboxylate transport system substrate-binding protein
MARSTGEHNRMIKKTHPFWPIALILTLLGFSARGIADEKPTVKTISIATLAPPGSTWMKVFDAWNREVRRRSNKTLELRFYPGGVQGDEAEVIKKIRSGRLDGAAVTAVGLSQIYRPALVFGMPGILKTYAQLDAARAALAPEMNPKFAESGFQMLGWADVGWSYIFSTAPVSKPSDLSTRKPWVWREDLVLPALYKVVKSNPVPLQLPEVLGALQTNRIDTLMATPVSALAFQWNTRVSNMLDLPLTVVIGGTVMGQKQWDSLTPEQKTIMTETSAQFHALARKNLRADEEKALTTLKEHNIKMLTPSDAEKAEWLKLGAEVRKQLTGQVADQALIDRVSAFGK